MLNMQFGRIPMHDTQNSCVYCCRKHTLNSCSPMKSAYLPEYVFPSIRNI